MSKQDHGGRLDELESRLAFQDDLIDSLNTVVSRQDREIGQLRRQLQRLEDRLAELADAASLPGPASGHEIPPHY